MFRRSLIPFLLPYVTRWITAQERQILAQGVPLDSSSLADARRIGVSHPERVRLLHVPQILLPGGPLIAWFGQVSGASWKHTAGLTARYGIFIRADYQGDRHLIAHELAHTAQYE